MGGFLRRTGFRLFLLLFFFVVPVLWLLALPYAALTWQTRRDHLRDIAEWYDLRSLRGMLKALRLGRTI